MYIYIHTYDQRVLSDFQPHALAREKMSHCFVISRLRSIIESTSRASPRCTTPRVATENMPYCERQQRALHVSDANLDTTKARSNTQMYKNLQDRDAESFFAAARIKWQPVHCASSLSSALLIDVAFITPS